MYDLLIVGSGPAGLGAAVYGARAGLHLAVIDKSPISGGQVLTTYEVDNYLGLPGMSGSDISDTFRGHVDKMGVSFIEAEVKRIEEKEDTDGKERIKLLHTDQGVYEARTVILATGASHAMLGVPGEMKLAGMGVSYCATCDGAFFRGRTTAVIGGGDVAVEDAIFLAGICKKVYLIHRRDSLRAADMLQKKLQKLSNVEILWDSEVTEICGDEVVEAVTVRNKKSGEIQKVALQGVFIAVGILPNTEAFKEFVTTDEKGYIVAGEDCAASVPGIFAAGDIRTKPLRQIITAVADGANAVNAVQNYFIKL